MRGVIVESKEYRQAQEALLKCEIFTQMLTEIGAKELQGFIEADPMSFNVAAGNEYRSRGGGVSVYGFGDWRKAAVLWIERQGA